MVIQRQILCFLFLTLYAVAIIRPYTPYVNYYLNKEQIAEEKCVNKDKPVMECDGKCYLKKQIISMQEDEEDSSSLVKIEIEKYLHDIKVQLGSSIATQLILDKGIVSINSFSVLDCALSVPAPPPKKYT